MNNKSFQELLDQTHEMIHQFNNVEQKTWGIEGSMMELSKQVGDLSKRVMMSEKYYHKGRETNLEYEYSQEKIADELFDIWFCLIRIADYYKIDFEKTIDKVTKFESENFKQGKIQ